jgi:hypothetical protein
MSYLTEAEIDDLQASDLSRGTPFAIQGVSNTQLSIARHYGCCTFQHQRYTYFPDSDELIRDDVLKRVMKRRKPKKVVGALADQGNLI